MSEVVRLATASERRDRSKGVIAPPGTEGLWVFIFADLGAFALFFALFSIGRVENPALYEASRLTLSPTMGLLNTLCLLTSSWTMVGAVEAARHGDRRGTRVRLGLTLGVASIFFVTKLLEYHGKFSAGLTPQVNEFYMYYFAFTGIHFLHYLIGMGVLLFLWFRLAGRGVDDQCWVLMESGGCYWHMVDLLWLVLYPLLYLLRAN